jgi:hypothetical protein
MRAEYTLMNRGRSHLTINATTIPPHGKAEMQIDMTAELLSTLMKQHIEVRLATGDGVLVNMEIIQQKAEPIPVVETKTQTPEPDTTTAVAVAVEPPDADAQDADAPVAEVQAAQEEAVEAEEADADAPPEEEPEESPQDERRKELQGMHGNTVKATAKRLGIEGADGMKKDDLIEKILLVEFPA